MSSWLIVGSEVKSSLRLSGRPVAATLMRTPSSPGSAWVGTWYSTLTSRLVASAGPSRVISPSCSRKVRPYSSMEPLPGKRLDLAEELHRLSRLLLHLHAACDLDVHLRRLPAAEPDALREPDVQVELEAVHQTRSLVRSGDCRGAELAGQALEIGRSQLDLLARRRPPPVSAAGVHVRPAELEAPRHHRLRRRALQPELAARDRAESRRVRDAELAQVGGEVERGIVQRGEIDVALHGELAIVVGHEMQPLELEAVLGQAAGELPLLVAYAERRQTGAEPGHLHRAGNDGRLHRPRDAAVRRHVPDQLLHCTLGKERLGEGEIEAVGPDHEAERVVGLTGDADRAGGVLGREGESKGQSAGEIQVAATTVRGRGLQTQAGVGPVDRGGDPAGLLTIRRLEHGHRLSGERWALGRPGEPKAAVQRAGDRRDSPDGGADRDPAGGSRARGRSCRRDRAGR